MCLLGQPGMPRQLVTAGSGADHFKQGAAQTFSFAASHLGVLPVCKAGQNRRGSGQERLRGPGGSGGRRQQAFRRIGKQEDAV